MNKKGSLLKISLIIILLQGLSYCSSPEKTNSVVEQYFHEVLKTTSNKDIYCNYVGILQKSRGNLCLIFTKYFEQSFSFDLKQSKKSPYFITVLGKQIPREIEGFTVLAHIATLAQDSPRCWNAKIKKIENIIKSTKASKWTRFKGMFQQQKSHMSASEIQNSLKEAKFLYEIFLDSAARSYAVMGKIYVKNKEKERWYHIPMRLLKTPPDFYILAVLHSIKVHMPQEFEHIKEKFLENFAKYLASELPEDDADNNIIKEIKRKSTPSYLSRYWKWVLAGIVTTVGVSYWIYKNQASYQKGGVKGLAEEAAKQIGAIPGKIKEKIFGKVDIKKNIDPDTGTEIVTKDFIDSKGVVKTRIIEQKLDNFTSKTTIDMESRDEIEIITTDKNSDVSWTSKDTMGKNRERYIVTETFNNEGKLIETLKEIRGAGIGRTTYSSKEIKDPSTQITTQKITRAYNQADGKITETTEEFDKNTGKKTDRYERKK